MATVGIAEGETSMVGLGTGMQHASIPDDWIRVGGKMKEILRTPVPQLKPIVRMMFKNGYVIGVSAENASAIANFELAGFRKFDKLESEMAAKEKVAEEGQDDFTEMTADEFRFVMANSLTADEFRFKMAKFEPDLRKFNKFESLMASWQKVPEKIDILCNVPPQVPYVNVSSLGKLGSFLRDLSGKAENYTEMAGDEDKMKIGWKEASCGLIMGANYTALASFEKRDGALGEAAWMAATLAFLITLFGVVAPLKMPRSLFGLAVILTGLSYMAFVAMKFA